MARATRALTKTLPDAAKELGDGEFLKKNLKFPGRSPHSRGRELMHGWKRNGHHRQEAFESSSETSPDYKIAIFCDLFSSKGQKTTSSFGFAQLNPMMRRYINSRPVLRGRIAVQTINGHRTSRQAAGVHSFLSTGKRYDHRSVKETDLGSTFKGPMPDSFKYFWCPVTKRILRRDPPAASNCSIIGHCIIADVERPEFFCPKSAQ